MEKTDFVWLLEWSKIYQDKKSKNTIRIFISTIDNPGWVLRVNLENTKLLEKKFQKIKIERAENDWVVCNVKNNQFEGITGPENFSEVLKVFRNWVEE